ncbi:hypothetical protein BKI52_10335 [marine bacterium AO1-C]|nr:hypothetical protein BKI52_10335 [marine bacterium AO1-C]
MNYYRALLTLLVLWGSISGTLWAQAPLVINPNQTILEENVFKEHLLIYEDTTQKLQFVDVQHPDFQQYFKTPTKKSFKYQYTYWGRMVLLNKDPQQRKWILRLDGYNSEVEVHIKQANGQVLVKKTGEFVPASQKEYNEATYPMVSVNLPYNQPVEIFVKVLTILKDAPTFKVSLLHPDKIRNYREWKRFAQGVFQGVFWILILYNLILFLIVKNKTYLFYSLYMVFIALYSLYYQGFTREYVFSEIPLYNAVVWAVCANIIAVLYYAFMRSFLNTAQLIPKTDRWIRYYMVFRLILLPVELFTYYGLRNSPLTDLLTLCSTAIDALFASFVLVVLYRTRDIAARYFIVGAVFLYTAVILMVLLHGYSKLVYAIIYQLGTSLEVLLFSLGLGYQVKATEQEKQNAQKALITQLHEKETLQRKHAEELEVKVIERTNEVMQQQEELIQYTEHLKEANQLIEDKNAKIIESINAASNIQTAILPQLDRMKRVLPELFVFFKPLDIVSGDFYWFAHHTPEEMNTSGEKVILAAVDCTGHGIPGAFMSILGDTYLNHIVNIERITSPDIILNTLHRGIRQALNQHITHNRDGMDLSIAVIDYKQKKLEFAGAKNALLYIQNGEMKELKGDKFSVGGEQREQERIYTKQTISLEAPTTIYLYSDGFQDQFGGTDNKKFLKSRFRELLFQYHKLPMEEQHHRLEDALHQWMDGYEQIDDILVLGTTVDLTENA